MNRSAGQCMGRRYYEVAIRWERVLCAGKPVDESTQIQSRHAGGYDRFAARYR